MSLKPSTATSHTAFKVLTCWGLCFFKVEVVEGVAGEEDHHDDQEEQGEENADAEGQHDEHDEDGEPCVTACAKTGQLKVDPPVSFTQNNLNLL